MALAPRSHSLALAIAFAAATPVAAQTDPEQEPDISWMNEPIASVDGFFATPWACASPDPGVQSVLNFHLNWHCSNPDNSGANWGSRFLGFHRQFLRGYEVFSAGMGFPNIQTFVPAPGAIIPPEHNGRPANSPCTGQDANGVAANCQAVPNQFRVPAAGGTLDDFASENAIGDAVVTWHNRQHTRIGFASTAAGGFGDCVAGDGTTGLPDIRCNAFAPRDPIFYRYHNLFNDIQDSWRRFQPTDVMIVFDRSGSMSLPAGPAGSRLDAAKAAANLFADLLENGGGSQVGLVTFSSAAPAVPELPLTGAGAAPAAMAAALGPVTAGGSTSIGAGLAAAQAVIAGSDRPAVLLLTDGMENTAPAIASVAQGAPWVPVHLCAVGFGTAGGLDGPKLRDLAERQGGIYVSGPEPLALRKFFVDCFADIFDTFVGMDPVVALEPGDAASPPISHTALGDRKLAFIASWSEPVVPGALRLRVTSPSGRVVQADDPGVESSIRGLWHVLRFPLPVLGEQDGVWQAQVVRGPRFFADGFTGDAFVDPAQGVALVSRQLRELCPAGCANVLYYEDEMPMTIDMSFEDHNSVFGEALFNQVPAGTVTNVTRIRSSAEFAKLLDRRDWDLIVYASKFAQEDQPHDAILARRLCDPDGPPAIVSDNRKTEGATRIWDCVGVKPTGETDWDAILADGVLAEEDIKLAPYGMGHGAFSFGLAPTGDDATGAAQNSVGSAAIIRTAAVSPARQELFINALTDSSARVVPHLWRSHTYTGEDLHPAFHIPESFWPIDGFDSVKAVVRVTRPLRGLGALAAEQGQERMVVDGDALDPRAAALLRLDPKQTGEAIGSETLEFPLFDDGTNGDGVPGDRYWEAALPPKVTEADGEYELHALFEICKGGVCVPREARHKVVVQSKLDRDKTGIERAPGPRGRTDILLTPRDAMGAPMGPGLADRLIVTGKDAKVVGVAEDPKRPGTYRIAAIPTAKEATVTVAQFGRPREALVIPLAPAR